MPSLTTPPPTICRLIWFGPPMNLTTSTGIFFAWFTKNEQRRSYFGFTNYQQGIYCVVQECRNMMVLILLTANPVDVILKPMTTCSNAHDNRKFYAAFSQSSMKYKTPLIQNYTIFWNIILQLIFKEKIYFQSQLWL